MTIRVVLGEDNVLVREGVRALLDSYEDIEVVGVAADAPSLLSTAAEHEPDVVVTDIKMPPSFQLEGIDCAHTIRDSHPSTGVVVLSAGTLLWTDAAVLVSGNLVERLEYGGSAAHVTRGNQMGDVNDPHAGGDPGGDSVAGGDEPVVKPVVGEEREAVEGGHER